MDMLMAIAMWMRRMIKKKKENKMNKSRCTFETGEVLCLCVMNACLFECEKRAGFPPRINALCWLLVVDSYQ